MGNNTSAVRSTQFQHPTPAADNIPEDTEEHHISISNKMAMLKLQYCKLQIRRLAPTADCDYHEVVILPSSSYARLPFEYKQDDSLSSRMKEFFHQVERLVEDATLTSGTVAVPPPVHKPDHKEKIYIEKLKSLDETHSERTGLTFDDLQSLAARIDMRTANLPSVEPVCADCQEKVIECYEIYCTPEDNFKCWDTVSAFRTCVQETAQARLHERSLRDARSLARRSRNVALARGHDLRDLPVLDTSTPA